MKTYGNNDKFIIRTDRAGVFFAKIVAREDSPSGVNLTIADARKIHGWDGACAVQQLALDGPQTQGGNNRWTGVVPEMEVMSVIEIIPVSEVARAKMEAMPVWKKG